ncbi:WXG repeat protein [Frankia sp. EI5c]|uniref:WXG100 family type VII secretion target n=1 Tax=Frankia sp. EI5c TaxID=683316 RepID=UPI0007C3E98A|nr:WXG100 family type VII secretion target [Frankia sp. EI5c]OAA20855.1 WXG repeat protein [Frankia sp. EI5c]
MAVIGAEIGDLNGLNTSLKRQSGVVDTLLSELTTQVQNAHWKGGAADRFRASWETEYRPALRSLSAALTAAADEVRRRAEALTAAGS